MSDDSSPRATAAGDGPLAGLMVLDMGVLVAGPMVGGILGDFGATVIKVERPDQPDPMRNLYKKDGVGLFSKIEDRNKLPVTLDLKQPAGQEIFRALVERADVLIENYRPGVLARLGFPDPELSAARPELVICHISGWGQTGPFRQRGSFGRIAEAFGGFAHLNGEADGPPMHSAVSLGDSLGSVWAVIGILLALQARERDGVGQVIDLGLYEPTLRQIEQQLVVKDQLGYALHRQGNENPAVATVNTYQTQDGEWFSTSNATPRTMAGYLRALGLQDDPRFASPELRQTNARALHAAARAFISERSAIEVDELFAREGAVGTPIQSAAEIMDHPQVLEREMVVEVDDPDFGSIRMQGIVPKLSRTPGRIRWPGRDQGSANAEVYTELLGLDPDKLAQLESRGVI